jgi:hypothetical protein
MIAASLPMVLVQDCYSFNLANASDLRADAHLSAAARCRNHRMMNGVEAPDRG